MERKNRPKMARSLRLGMFIAAILGLVTGLLAWHQVQTERRIDLDDVASRSHVLAQQLSGRVLTSLQLPDLEARASLEGRLDGYRLLLGYAVFRADGRLVTAGPAVAEFAEVIEAAVVEAIASKHEVIRLTRAAGARLHILAEPIPEDGPTVGVLVVAHDVSYLDDRATARFATYAFWILIVTLLAVTLVVGSTWLAYERPLSMLADWMRRLRVDDAVEAPPGLPTGRLRSESDRLAASFRAARSTGRALSEAAMHTEQVWTPDRLRAHAVAALGDANQLIVVSNREPYMHQHRDGKTEALVPAGGVVTALDPVLQACGGVWIAHGAGDADRATSDAHGRLTVPPGDGRYTSVACGSRAKKSRATTTASRTKACGRSATWRTSAPSSARAIGSSIVSRTGVSRTPCWTKRAPARRWCWCRTTNWRSCPACSRRRAPTFASASSGTSHGPTRKRFAFAHGAPSWWTECWEPTCSDSTCSSTATTSSRRWTA
jgi:trehalose 6-phosphate synthase